MSVRLVACALLLLAVSEAQTVKWRINAPTSSNIKLNASGVAFVDEDFVVLQRGPTYRTPSWLQLYAVATQQVVWTQPNPCPFNTTTGSYDPSSPTATAASLSVYHVRRTGATSLTYLCWVNGQKRGHVVTVSTATGDTIRTTALHTGALQYPISRFVLGSVASGAYCTAGNGDAVCVSSAGDVWHLGLDRTSPSYDSPWINEYNGTLVIQSVEASTLKLYDLWTGTLKSTLNVPYGSSPGSVAGKRYLNVLNTQPTPCTSVTLDMHTGTLSGIVTLPGSQSQSDTGQGASTTALMLADGRKPMLITTLPSQPFGSLLGWRVPATTPHDEIAKKLFDTPLGSGSDTLISWAVSPGYVVVVYSNQYQYTSGTLASMHVLRVGDGQIVQSFHPEGGPIDLTSVAERDGYFVATGTYSQDSTTFSGGSGVVAFNSSTGHSLWSKGNAEVVGPDHMPLDKANMCVMVAPSQGYIPEDSTTETPNTDYGSVQCIAL